MDAIFPRELAGRIRKEFGLKSRSKASLDFLLTETCRKAQVGDLPYCCYTAAYGIAYALQTGRASSEVALAIRKMTPREIVALIAAAAAACPTIGDVPRFVNSCADILRG